MKKDIPIHPVTDVGIAIVQESKALWDVFLLNLKGASLRNLIIKTKGYGEVKGTKVTTTCMRYYFETIPAQTAVKVEPISPELLELANEYWISFSLNNYMYDRKFVFVKGSISTHYFTTVPLLETNGVLII